MPLTLDTLYEIAGMLADVEDAALPSLDEFREDVETRIDEIVRDSIL